MATVVNNPQPAASDSSGMGFLLGAILIIVFAIIFFVYLLPILQNSFQGAQAPQINVPDKVDVNVKQQK